MTYGKLFIFVFLESHSGWPTLQDPTAELCAVAWGSPHAASTSIAQISLALLCTVDYNEEGRRVGVLTAVVLYYGQTLGRLTNY